MTRYNKTYVPSKSSSSYSNKEERGLVTADGLLINSLETLFPAESDGAYEPIDEQCRDLDPKRADALFLLLAPISPNDEVVVVDDLFPFIFPIPLRLHLLDNIRAEFIFSVPL